MTIKSANKFNSSNIGYNIGFHKPFIRPTTMSGMYTENTICGTDFNKIQFNEFIKNS